MKLNKKKLRKALFLLLGFYFIKNRKPKSV